MDVNACIVFFTACCLVLKATLTFGNLFYRLSGYRMNTTTSSSIISIGDQKLCCFHCLSEKSCRAVNYKTKTKECELSAETPWRSDVFHYPEWDIYYAMTNSIGEWELAFRTSAGNEISPVKAWMNKSYAESSDDYRCKLMINLGCRTLYRNRLIDQWKTSAIKEVKLELYKSGKRVAFLIFNAEGTEADNWFNSPGLISSGWPTLSKKSTFQVFEMAGKTSRTFSVQQKYQSCPYDEGWLVVHDNTMEGMFACKWDVVNGYPAFHYSTRHIASRWESDGYGIADVLAIFIKQ